MSVSRLRLLLAELAVATGLILSALFPSPVATSTLAGDETGQGSNPPPAERSGQGWFVTS